MYWYFRSNSNWNQKTFVSRVSFQNEFSLIYSRIYFHFHFHHCFFYCLFINFFFYQQTYRFLWSEQRRSFCTTRATVQRIIISHIFNKNSSKVFILYTEYVKFNLCYNIQQDIHNIYIYKLYNEKWELLSRATYTYTIKVHLPLHNIIILYCRQRGTKKWMFCSLDTNINIQYIIL